MTRPPVVADHGYVTTLVVPPDRRRWHIGFVRRHYREMRERGLPRSYCREVVWDLMAVGRLSRVRLEKGESGE